ncbi:glycosyltransferase [Saccharopolyspora sp. HNM0983]|uniref:Glycosyltransferase n=1 Tax=Saccharopolyspora montiporae TaxID=2781240 RepID=A0A929G0L5_9PSEU|nr:nucleotide disphospho-sugar-binding domain-containing protein [Saccharopolyspora sp. HNM0983]MBE9375459.1 glycosyltransferase [Saccharopolyspora sp. HNM0983]
MRIFVASAPLLGHVFPMIPLARALRDAGHEVLVATAGHGLAARRHDLPVEDIAPNLRFGRIAGRVLLGHPLIARAELAGEGGLRGLSRIFAAVNDEMADGAVALADRYEPDLVVHEPLAVFGALAAARRGAPAVVHENSLFDPAELTRSTAARLGKTFQRHGVPSLPASAGSMTISPTSVVGPRSGMPMRYEPVSVPGEIPDWLREPPRSCPRILVSRSTVDGPWESPMVAAVTAAPEVDAEFVLVRPDDSIIGRELADNVRTVDWIPINDVLPTCAGIVHHGGAGSIFGALAGGTPQLMTPGAGDRKHNAQLVARRGAGLAVSARDIVAAHLKKLVEDPALTAQAHEVRTEMAAMPAPEELVPRLEKLAA